MPQILTYVLKHPEAPKSLNDGGAGSKQHWGTAARDKAKWAEVYACLLELERVPRGAEQIRLDAVLRFKVRRRRDVTNFEPALVKAFADVLVDGTTRTKKAKVRIAGGWIPDDTAEYFTFGELTFEHPKPWPSLLGDAEIELTLTCTYPDPITLVPSTSAYDRADLMRIDHQPDVHPLHHRVQTHKEPVSGVLRKTVGECVHRHKPSVYDGLTAATGSLRVA